MLIYNGVVVVCARGSNFTKTLQLAAPADGDDMISNPNPKRKECNIDIATVAVGKTLRMYHIISPPTQRSTKGTNSTEGRRDLPVQLSLFGGLFDVKDGLQ